MNNICDEVILYNLNKFLDVDDKCKLRLVNKLYYKLQSKAINFHIGTFIANYLGLNHECNNELDILRESKFEFLQEICNYLLNEQSFNINIKKNPPYQSPIGIILRINNSSLNECKIRLMQPNIFRRYEFTKQTNKLNRTYYNNNYLKKKFFNVYALI